MHPDALLPSEDALDLYRKALRAHGRREEALLWTKNKQTDRFRALCRDIPNEPSTLLDFGCGLGDLALWLTQHRPSISYFGVDALEEFIISNRTALPSYKFAHIAAPADITGLYDHIVCSGVFNLDPHNDAPRHWNYICSTISALSTRARRSLHIDFLAHDVDYRQSGAYHQDTGQLLRFVERLVSKRHKLDRSYMPYEFCASIFTDTSIDKNRNTYVSEDQPGVP